MRIEHRISSVFAGHLAEMKSRMEQLEAEALRLEGQAARLRKEAEFVKSHSGQIISLIVDQDKLPETVGPFVLSGDSSCLIGETRDGQTT